MLESVGLGIVALVASILGSMLGLGGGVFIVPMFTLFFGIDPILAVGASAVCVVTNSVVGSSVHLRSGFTNIRLALVLQVTTALGALGGALIAVDADPAVINGLLGAVLIYSAFSMSRRRRGPVPNAPADAPDPLALRASYADSATGRDIVYVPHGVGLGAGISGVAGVLSGMLGIGGGVIQVPMMNLVMRVPVKAAAGTSALMVGITAVATASVLYAEGKIEVPIVVPAMIGVFLGSRLGSTITRRLPTERLVFVFIAVLGYLGISLVLKAVGVSLPGQS